MTSAKCVGCGHPGADWILALVETARQFLSSPRKVMVHHDCGEGIIGSAHTASFRLVRA